MNGIYYRCSGENMIDFLLYVMIRRKSCGFIKVFMLEERVTQANIIKSTKQCDSFTIMSCYASRITAAYGRFYCLTIFQFAH